jgi:DnaJ-class molecular chaperone
MNARPNPYALTFGDLTWTLVSVKDQLRALADAPHSLNRLVPPECSRCRGKGYLYPATPNLGYPPMCRACDGTGYVIEDVPTETQRELAARLNAELAEDDPPGWDDCDVDRYEDAESVADGFEEQW